MADADLENLAANTERTPISDDSRPLLAPLGGRWSIDGGELQLRLPGPMTRTGAVAARAGALADELDHHPRIVLEYEGLTLRIHTHDRKTITMLDVAYAARLERWLRANGWPD